MNRFIYYTLILLFMIACKQEKKTNEYIDAPIDTPLPVETELNLDETVKPDAGPQFPLSYIIDYKGKYAKQENLFGKGLLAQRLQKMERFNYEALLQNYQTETKITIINNIVHMSGCKQHSCPSNAYDFFIDLENDNINIYYFRNNMLRVYNEKGFIDLPQEFSEEMEIKKSNAGIGDTSGIESSYEL